MQHKLNLIGRLLIAQIFLLAGISKIGGYAATAGYMDAMGVSSAMLPGVIALEIGGALALIVGWQIRWAAAALAAFTVLAAALFHSNLGDQVQMLMFTKNIAIAGGLLILSANGAGTLSVDNWLRNKNRQPLATAR